MFDVDFWILFGPADWRSKSVFACSWLEPLIHIRRCICLDYNWGRTVKKKEYNVLIHESFIRFVVSLTLGNWDADDNCETIYPGK